MDFREEIEELECRYLEEREETLEEMMDIFPSLGECMEEFLELIRRTQDVDEKLDRLYEKAGVRPAGE